VPREFNRNERLYDPGVYQFSVDSFTRDDTSRLDFVMTADLPWPTNGGLPIMNAWLTWSTGLTVGGPVDGPETEKGTGVLQNFFRLGCTVPELRNHEKAQVVSGTITVELFVPIRAAVSVRAL
jgi:hypothetical protein